MTVPLSEALARAAKAQREREGREAVAGWLRRLAERISPDRSYVSIRARVRYAPARGLPPFIFAYTETQHVEGEGWDEPDPRDGVRLYVRAADRDALRTETR